MGNRSGSQLPPFPSSYRASGLLLHDEAKSFVGSWNDLMEVIASKSATLAKAS